MSDKMNIEELAIILQQGEGYNVEFKQIKI